MLVLSVADTVLADGEVARPTYQRSRGGWNGGGHGYHGGGRWSHYPPHHQYDRRHDRGRGSQPAQVSGGSFQRPYPYHLDYYKMRWGGSYAPYFGNLYGPPNVVLAQPFGFGGGYPVPYETPPMYGAPPMQGAPMYESPPAFGP